MSSSILSAFTDNYRTIPGLYTLTDLSAAQFKAIKLLSTVGQVGLVSTSVPASAVFVLMNDPKGASGAPVNVEAAYEGIVKMIAGTSTIKQGDALAINTTGYVVTTTTANRWIIGYSLSNSGTVADIISVVLIPGGAKY